jgi:hypothetical protein
MSADDDRDEPEGAGIVLPDGQLAGVWANAARVIDSPHEFTFDFMRMDYSLGTPPRRGIVVARVGVSPMFVVDFIRQLNVSWASYAERAMREEAQDDEG